MSTPISPALSGSNIQNTIRVARENIRLERAVEALPPVYKPETSVSYHNSYLSSNITSANRAGSSSSLIQWYSSLTSGTFRYYYFG
jgi:hypothetical protein